MSAVNSPIISSQLARALANRYRDGYRVARLISGLGRFIKVVGTIAATILFLLVAVPWLQGQSSRPIQSAEQFLAMAVAALPAGAVLLMSLIIGTLLSAAGQVTMAQLDSAVHTSPFLAEDDRLQAMGLFHVGRPHPVPPVRGEGEPAPTPPLSPDAALHTARVCPVCLKEVSAPGSRFCQDCGAPLGES